MTQEERGSEQDEEKLLSITEAARALGVSERTLRRLLEAPETAARVRQTKRHAGMGRRSVKMLPPDLIADLAAGLERNGEMPEAKEAASSDSGNKAAQSPAYSGDTAAESGRLDLDTPQLPALYQTLMSNYERQVTTLTARIEFLEEALKREQENVHREQTLRLSLAAPVAAADEEKPSTQTRTEPTAGGTDEPPPTEQQQPPWWQFWRRTRHT